jgi:transcription elongation factor GreA
MAGSATNKTVLRETMIDKPVFLTAEGRTKLEKELEFMVSVRRREIAQRIHSAKDQGDITDNAEYEDAKNEQAFVEGRILELESKLRNAVLIANLSNNSGVVTLGCTVTLRDSDGENARYTIVGSAEAKPAQGRISNESPVGRALLGRSIGEEVPVRTPGGSVNYTILTVE